LIKQIEERNEKMAGIELERNLVDTDTLRQQHLAWQQVDSVSGKDTDDDPTGE
jgi:hypothetical protein